jgi:hypothetical protein
MLAAAATPGVGAVEPVDSTQIKAAFVLNFLKFVEWPAATPDEPTASIVIAVLGDAPLEAELQRTRGTAQVGGRAVTVRRVEGADEAGDAHLLFIGASTSRTLAATLRALENKAVLTVGDTRGFAEAGVILNLYEFDRRMRIEVNTTAAARAQLRLSAHLLRIARIVG